MGEQYEGADSLHAVLTGASNANGIQRDHSLSLGGFYASDRIACMTAYRGGPMSNVQILYVSGSNGIGMGNLIASGANELRWQPPGGTLGTGVTIANGETKVLNGGSGHADKYIIVERTSAVALAASETIQLIDTVNNVIGGSNFDEDDTFVDTEKYAGIQFVNRSSLEITDLLVWVDLPVSVFRYAVQIAGETPTAGEIQTIADEDTAPTGLSWSAPTTEGTALNLGTIAAGVTVGLWIERAVDTFFPKTPMSTNAQPIIRNVIEYRFTVDGAQHYGTLRGATRTAEKVTEGWFIYWGINEPPDVDLDPDEFVEDDGRAGIADELTTSYSGSTGDIYLQVRFRSKYGIIGPQLIEPLIFRLVSGLETGVPPTAPSNVQVRAYTEGEVKIEAQYFPAFDESDYRADAWAVWITDDGTTPDTSADPDYTEAMSSFEGGSLPRILSYTTSGSYIEGAPIQVIVRTMRTDVEGETETDVFSTNTDVSTATISYCGPARSIGIASFKKSLGIQQSAPTLADTTVWIDEPNNIYWLVKPGQTQLWADTVLVGNLRYDSGDSTYDGFWTTFSKDGATISEVGSAKAIDVISWTAGDKRLGVNVQGTRVMEIDVTNTNIRFEYFDQVTTPSGSCQSVPAAIKYDNTSFQVWDAATEDYATPASLNADGGVWSLVPWLQFATQAECLI